MALKSIMGSLVRRQYLSRCRTSLLSPAFANSLPEIPTARMRLFSKEQYNIAVSTRALSTFKALRYATVEESLNFRDQDRESDQVDVCIVGGGNRPACSPTNID
jgi:hypothetical protein